MKISIDLQNMRVMHKHEKLPVVANLAWIECRHGEYAITDADAKSFLHTCTDMELKILYRNITGQETHFLGSSVLAILAELIDRMPISDINPYELEIQASKIQDGDMKGYRYTKGSYIASCASTLFPEGLKAEKDINEASVAAKGRHKYSDSKIVSLAMPVAAPKHQPAITPKGSHTPTAQRQPSTPRQGGVKEIIWKVADKLWGDAGSPTEKSLVLNLRKTIMAELENNHQVKRNTSSNELGNWQKARLPI